MASVVALRNASVTLGGKSILRAVTLSIAAAERVAIVGANGAGKSTLLRALHGIVALDEGTLHAVASDQQAMIFQRPPLLRTTVLEHVQFSLKTATNVPDKLSAARTALAACGMNGFESQFTRSLSGGEQQRLALACVWARNPKLLLADECTASLDLNAVQAVESLLLQLSDRGCALVFTTHSLAQAKRLAQRIVFLHEGQCADDQSTEHFFGGKSSEIAHRFIEGERW